MSLPNSLPPSNFHSPISARHIEPSLLYSADDDYSTPVPELIDLAVAAISGASSCDLSAVSARIHSGPRYPDIWPGEHYKLLASLMRVLQPQVIVEIGTGSGLSALSMKSQLPEGSRIYTFDLIPYQQMSTNVLSSGDFVDGKLTQIIANIADSNELFQYREIIASAEFIFIDAAKDGECESRLLSNLSEISFVNPPVVMFDDIRLWNMLALWRRISKPKLDLTSFGHWSGTGLILW